jgi:hypothetical protein
MNILDVSIPSEGVVIFYKCSGSILCKHEHTNWLLRGNRSLRSWHFERKLRIHRLGSELGACGKQSSSISFKFIRIRFQLISCYFQFMGIPCFCSFILACFHYPRLWKLELGSCLPSELNHNPKDSPDIHQGNYRSQTRLMCFILSIDTQFYPRAEEIKMFEAFQTSRHLYINNN